jgi:hypothetical protein
MLTNLADDQIKLVAYTIVCTKPTKERIMPGGQGSLVITDNLTEDQFVAYVIARYLRPEKGSPPDVGDVFDKQTDWKYLRVHYVVSARWPKEPLNADQRQAEALEEIRDLFPAGHW